MPDLLSAHGLRRTYATAGEPGTDAVAGVDLRIHAPGIYAITGRSGSGKSTLLHMLAGLDRPTAGEVRYRGKPLAEHPERALARLRRDEFGFVFQRFHLVPTLTGRQNILLPTQVAGGSLDPAWVGHICAALDLDREMLRRRPDALSGGQQQRIAIARAMARRPRVLFADEPTGSLDSGLARTTMALFTAIATESVQATRVVIVTHHEDLAAQANHHICMHDGRIVHSTASLPAQF